jgi:hypothetical protein
MHRPPIAPDVASPEEVSAFKKIGTTDVEKKHH